LPIHLSVVMPVYNERYLVAASVSRVLEAKSPHITRLDLIIVDDGSTDGTRDILREMAEKSPDRILYIEHERNRGKGAAVRTGIQHAKGEVTVVHDADLEYDPRDLERLMLPFLEEDADAVYGSRFLASGYRRVLYYRHALGNWLLTHVCNLVSDLNLTDMETCYKAVRTPLLQSIPLRSDDFRIEPELTIKLAKREARVFEVPINYAGRTYDEGKKIGFRDAVLAVLAMVRFSLSNDVHRQDVGGADALMALSAMPRFNRWMADAIRPFMGARVLEIGSGVGNLTKVLLPRDRYTVSDVNPDYLARLRSYAATKPYMDAAEIDVTSSDDFYEHMGAYDTVVCLNVLEHVEDEPEGRLILLVPQGPGLFGSLDELVGHRRRYSRESLESLVASCGLETLRVFDFNRVTLPGWWLNGRVLRRRSFSTTQLGILERLTWLVRRLDRFLPWRGASLIAVVRRPVGPLAAA
jgi:SAM-dependent methyltransferase